jgi:hypothetical protein
MVELRRDFTTAFDSGPGYESLELVSGKDRADLRSIAQLKGKVEIRDRDEALAFVRLLTDPGTAPYFGTYMNEVVPMTSWKRPHVYADPDVAAFVVNFSNDTISWGGAASESVLSKIEFHRPIVTEKDALFTITRLVIEGDAGERNQLSRITETVARDGAYELVTREPRDSRGHKWILAPRPINSPRIRSSDTNIQVVQTEEPQ